MNYIIEGKGALVNEAGEETPLKAGDFALVDPSEKHQYRNKGDKPFKMICGVPKEFEWRISIISAMTNGINIQNDYSVLIDPLYDPVLSMISLDQSPHPDR